MRAVAILTAGFFALGALPSSAPAEKEKEKTKTEGVRIGPATFQAPTTWKRQRPRSRMRTLQYGIPLVKGDKGKAEFVVFYFGGGGGSVEDNLNRWKGQFQDVKKDPKVAKFKVDGMKATTLDISGTYKFKPAPRLPMTTLMKDHRMFCAIVDTPDDGPYFFKLVGPKKTIDAQEKNWNHLLKSGKLK